MTAKPRVVVCGGGAGGLELVTHLAGRGDVAVTLVDREESHIWKPLLHEVASGSLDVGSHEVSYLALARWHGFTFSLGALEGLDRARRELLVAPVLDKDGSVIIPPRRLAYDLAVIAIGGTTNDFDTPGVREHALALDSTQQAEEIRARVMKACMSAHYLTPERPKRLEHLDIVIVGGGATGVELAAELRSTTRALISYGLDRLDPQKFIEITVVNADPRLLMQLPEHLAEAVQRSLEELGIAVRNGEMVVEVTADHIRTRSGETIPANVTVWAAGIRAPDLLRQLDGLETGRLGQLVVAADLRTSRDPRVLAIGDCAAVPWYGHGGLVPARAQASSQQGAHVARYIRDYLGGGPVTPFRYQDFGSLVSLGPHGSAIGTLMGFVTGRSYRVSGFLAGLFYRWLYKRHRATLFGWPAALLETFSMWVGGVTRPRIKLH